MSDEELRRIYQARLAAAEPAQRDGCVRPEEIDALVRREGEESDRLRTLDHVMSCPACRRELDLLRSIHEAQAGHRRAWSGAPLALAASIAGLVAAGAVWQLARSPAPVLRDGGTGVTLLEPVGTVVALDTLRWTSAAEDAEYEVEVVGPDGLVVFRGATTDTLLAWPSGQALDAEVAYRWRLRVITLQRGEVLVGPVEFQLR